MGRPCSVAVDSLPTTTRVAGSHPYVTSGLVRHPSRHDWLVSAGDIFFYGFHMALHVGDKIMSEFSFLGEHIHYPFVTAHSFILVDVFRKYFMIYLLFVYFVIYILFINKF